MKWQCRMFGYALVRVGHLPFITEPSSLFILIFQKRSLLCSNSSANLPRKPSPSSTPTLPQTSPKNPPRTHLSATMKTLPVLWMLKPMLFEKPYPILIFKLFSLSQIPLKQLFPIPLNQPFPKPPQKTLSGATEEKY